MNSKIYNNLRLDLDAMAEPEVTVNKNTISAMSPGRGNRRCTVERSARPDQLRKFASDALAQAAAWEALALQAERDQDEKRSNGLDALSNEFYGVSLPFIDKRALRVITALYEARNPEAKS